MLMSAGSPRGQSVVEGEGGNKTCNVYKDPHHSHGNEAAVAAALVIPVNQEASS